jgi:DNA-binding FrmR family transcriptional regulator
MPSSQGRSQILNRLKSVDGHLRGVIKMVEEDAYCMDVVKQLQAVQGAIGRVNALLLQDHLQTCVTTAVRGDDAAERQRVLAELLSLFEHGATLGAVPDDAAPQGGVITPRAET